MQGNITLSSLTSPSGREWGQPHDLHFWLLTLQGPRWLTGLCVSASYRSSINPPSSRMRFHKCERTSPNCCPDQPIQHPGPTQSDRAEGECALSKGESCAFIAWIAFDAFENRLDTSLQVSTFEIFLGTLTRSFSALKCHFLL